MRIGTCPSKTICFLNNAYSSHAPYQNVPLGKGIFISRDHQYALVDWGRAVNLGMIKKGSILVHVDAHSDLGCPLDLLPKNLTTKAIQAFTTRPRKDLEMEFIAPAIALGLIGRMIQLAPQEDPPEKGKIIIQYVKNQKGISLEGLKLVKDKEPRSVIKTGKTVKIDWELTHLNLLNIKKGNNTLILDIDLDFFAKFQENLLLRVEKYGKVLKKLNPDLITIALSPDYTTFKEESYRNIINALLKFLGGSADKTMEVF